MPNTPDTLEPSAVEPMSRDIARKVQLVAAGLGPNPFSGSLGFLADYVRGQPRGLPDNWRTAGAVAAATRSTPVLQGHLTDPAFAGTAQHDLEPLHGIETAASAFAPETEGDPADRAMVNYRSLSDAVRAARASGMRQDDPESFRAFAAGVAEAAEVPHIHVAPDALDAVLATPEGRRVQAAIPDIARRVVAARDAGTDVPVTPDEYLTHVGPELHDDIAADVRVGTDAMTPAEAEADWRQRLADLDNASAQAEAGATDPAAFHQSWLDVTAGLRSQYDRDMVGQLSPQQRADAAELTGRVIAVEAAKQGLTPTELYQPVSGPEPVDEDTPPVQTDEGSAGQGMAALSAQPVDGSDAVAVAPATDGVTTADDVAEDAAALAPAGPPTPVRTRNGLFLPRVKPLTNSQLQSLYWHTPATKAEIRDIQANRKKAGQAPYQITILPSFGDKAIIAMNPDEARPFMEDLAEMRTAKGESYTSDAIVMIAKWSRLGDAPVDGHPDPKIKSMSRVYNPGGPAPRRVQLELLTNPVIDSSAINARLGTKVDLQFVMDREDGVMLKPYVPYARGMGDNRSGLTAGAGYDFGQHNRGEWDGVSSFDKALNQKLSPALGKQRQDAIDWADARPDLRLSPRQAELLMQNVFGVYVGKAVKLYNQSAKVPGQFSDMTPAQQTVFVDRYYNSNKAINAAFNNFVFNGDWKGAENYLRSQAANKSNSSALRGRLGAEAKRLGNN